AGEVATQGYPLAMLLHSLRPFLTESHCAEDAIGLVQYLFTHGKEYLSGTPSFVAGISLSILASLRAFLESSQDSTTQESQHVSTMSKAQAFHSWFGEYLEEYQSGKLKNSSWNAFRAILQSAKAIRAAGNSFNG